ncbi:MAG: pilus assembly protein [Chloroflexi bacterium]|nr:pilus assembly protein [Chloroflexota bacterium]
MTEFAILAPMFFLLIMILVEGGRIFSTWLVITDEAREGARYGVVGYGDPARQPTLVQDVQNYVANRIGTTMSTDPTRFAVNVQLNSGGQLLAVTVNYNVDIVTPLVQGLLPNPFPLKAVSAMRLE